MKNIFSILEELGIEIEEDKKKDLEKSLNENYKTINEYNNIKDNVEQLKEDIQSRDTDLENLTKQLEEVGDDKDKLQQAQDELKAFKTKYEEQTADYEDKLKKQEYEFAVKEHINGLHFSSNAGKRAFTEDLLNSELKLVDGKLIGFDDYVKEYKEKDEGVFSKEAKVGSFGGKTNGNTSKTTKEDIMKIEDRAKRQKAIAENIELFE